MKLAGAVRRMESHEIVEGTPFVVEVDPLHSDQSAPHAAARR